MIQCRMTSIHPKSNDDIKYSLEFFFFGDAVLLILRLNLRKLLVFDWTIRVIRVVTVGIVTAVTTDYLNSGKFYKSSE